MADGRTPTHMPTQNRPINAGKSMDEHTSRLDAIEKVNGAAKYGRDVFPENCLFVGFIRCPWGAARLDGVDEDAAKSVPGVLEINMTGREGRYHGQPVGYLVAESPSALERGRRALNPKWRETSSTASLEDAFESDDATSRETDSILADADEVLEATYATPVQTHSALETHGACIDWRGDRAVVYSSTQGTFAARDGIEGAIGLPQSRFSVSCEYVGGGFGSKLNGAGKEGVTAAEVAKKYKRPVWLFCNRAEDHLDTGNRPSSRSRVRVGFNRNGKILGGLIRTWGGVGVAGGGGGVSFPSMRYDFGKIEKRHSDVQFNGGGPRPFRAPGHPQGAFAEELMIDEIATRIGRDPIDLRRSLERSDERREMYDLGAELIGWGDRQTTGSQTGAIRRGFGMGTTDWNRFPARAEAEVVIHPDGSVEVRTGSQDIGTGQRTVMGVVAAARLGAPLEHVEVRIGDSTLPVGPGSGGSVTATNTSPAMMQAAEEAGEKLLARVAERTGHAARSLRLEGGGVMLDGESIATWVEACQMLGRESVFGRGSNGRDAGRRYGGEGHSKGAQFVEVEVDTETGVVRVKHVVAIQSCGRVVVRKTAESQIIGGVIQGISYALFENKLLDRNTGAMVNPNLEAYKVLGPGDMPHIEPVLWEKGQTGVRPLGEPPTIPTAGAVACAVFNAIGRPVRSLPLTPDRILAAMEGGER